MMDATPLSRPPNGLDVQLLAAKPALPNESLASWVQRVCGDHQYSMPTLIRTIGYEPRLRDWDLPVPHVVWERIRQLLSWGPEHDHLSLSTLGMLCSHLHPSQLLWHERRTPRYRWCRDCFKRDEIPYLRWFWRLSALTWCPVHGRVLSEACPTCGIPLLLHTSRLVASGRHGQASTLDQCDSCGMPLRASVPGRKVPKDRTTARLEILLSRVGELHQFIDATTAERARSYLAPMLPRLSKEEGRNSPRISLRKGADIGAMRPTSGPTNKELRKRLIYEKAWLRSIQCKDRLLKVLVHNEALAKNYKVYRKKAQKVDWSWSLDADSRVAMAAFLYITRQEKLAVRQSKVSSDARDRIR